MSRKVTEPKAKKKSKLEVDIEKISLLLKNKEISSMEFAMNFPMKVPKYSKKMVVQTAVSAFREKYGEKRFEEIQGDFDAIIGVVRHFVIGYMTTLMEAHEALENVKGRDKAFSLLTKRALEESLRVYPWLDDEYYQD